MKSLQHNWVDPNTATAVTPVIFFLDQGCRKVLKIDGVKVKSIVFLRKFLTSCYPMNNQNYAKTWLGQFNSGSPVHDNFAHPYSGHLSNGSWSANMHALKVKSYWMNSIQVQFCQIFCIIQNFWFVNEIMINIVVLEIRNWLVGLEELLSISALEFKNLDNPNFSSPRKCQLTIISDKK